MDNFKKISLSISVISVLSLGIVGCGGGETIPIEDNTTAIDDNQSQNQQEDNVTIEQTELTNPQTGKFVDSAVKGLKYICDSEYTGTTNILGEFSCEQDESVTFFLGVNSLGTIPPQGYITPFTLFNGNEEAGLNFAQLVQTLDIDNNLDNGIEIDTELLATLGVIDFTSATFDQDIQDLLTNSVTLVNEVDAQTHLDEVFARLGINPDGTPIVLTYSWNSTDWSNCQGECGTNNATQIREIVCKDSNNKTVENSLCKTEDEPTTSQNCTVGLCDVITYSWDTTDWSNCQGDCGTNNATQTRTSICKDSNNQTVDDTMCTEPKSTTSQSCTESLCDVITYSWSSSAWSSCIGECGIDTGEQTRTNICKDSNGNTVENSLCTNTEPSTLQACTTSPCAVTYSWDTSAWSSCVGDCGTNNGTQVRVTICKDSNDQVSDDAMCTEPKPTTSQSCTSSLCYIHNAVDGTITSIATSQVWMDKNLGTAQVCTSLDDEACYGGYYQWGRDTDGHQLSTSTTTETIATATNTPNHANFILDGDNDDDDGAEYDWTSEDDNGAIRSANWNPCPTGFRIPTIDELIAENIADRDDAYSKLKLPSAGFRVYLSGSHGEQGLNGNLWSSSPSSSRSKILFFNSDDSDWYNHIRANGFSVRCIMD